MEGYVKQDSQFLEIPNTLTNIKSSASMKL